MRKSLSQLFDEFIYECEFATKNRPETLRNYRQAFTILNKLMPNLDLESLTPIAMTTFFKVLNERKRIVGRGQIRIGVKKSTIGNYWTKLNKFFRWLKAKNLIINNPFDSMQFPKVEYLDRKFIRKQHIEKILTAIHSNSGSSPFQLKRNLIIFYILLFCGLRKEELVSLQVRDIDIERRVLTVRGETSKIPRTRHLPLHSQLIMYLKDYLKERRCLTTPFLIVSCGRDKGLSYGGLKHLVEKLRVKSGVKFHLHQFRHTFAVNFLNSSNNIVKLKQLMGHKNIDMTLVYLRCLPTNEMRGDIENLSIDSLI